MDDVSKATISRLLRIVAGDAPISHGVEVLAQDVIIHMDEFVFHGINSWAVWISYIRSRNRVSELDVEVDRLVDNPDGTITAQGRWKARRQGDVVYSTDAWARYRVVDGAVVELWSTRTNYALMLGPIMRSRLGHLLVMLQVFFWAKRSGVPDLRTPSALSTGTAPALTACEETVGS